MSQQNQVIALKGFLVKPHLPSEHLVIRRFNDSEPIIDEIGKVLSELPDDLTKRFTSIRARVYQKLIPDYSITLPTGSANSLRLVPLDRALPLQLEFQEKCVEELRKLDRDIRTYLAGRDERKAKLRTYLESKGQSTDIEIPNLAERASLEFIPFNIDMQYFRDFLHARERAGIEEVDEKKAEALAKMERDIADEKKRITESVIRELEKKASAFIEGVTPEIAKQNPVKVRKSISGLQEIRDTAESLGIESTLTELLDTSQALLEAYSSPETERAARVSEASQALRQLFDISANLSDTETLRQVTRMLNKDLNPRARALMREMELTQSVIAPSKRARALENEMALAARTE